MFKTADGGGLPQCYDLDADAGPQEVPENEWDGVTVWIGQVPSHGVCRVVADGVTSEALSRGMSLGMRPSVSPRVAKMFRRDWRLSDELRQHLDAVGEGLALDGDEAGQPVATVSQPRASTRTSWCLVTFRQPADAALLLASRLPEWFSTDGCEISSGLILRRALPAAQARSAVEEAEARENTRRDMVRLAVCRIFSWLNQHGESLTSLFKRIDKDNSGDFDESEFRAAMMEIGLTFNNKTIQAIFSFMDADGGGAVDTVEFSAFLLYAYRSQMARSAASVLLELSLYFDKTQETFKDLFRRVGQEVSLEDNGPDSLVGVDQLHRALVATDIKHSDEALHAVMAELDMNNDGSLSLFELTVRLSSYRRQRRHQAARVLNECAIYLRKTGKSARRLFINCADGTGELDTSQLHEVLGKMGQDFSADATAELMAELDLDGGGTIDVNEFLDKVRQATSERAAEAKRCQHFFSAADSDGSGYLEPEEVVMVASEMGLGDQVKNRDFLEQMMLEIETITSKNEAENIAGEVADGRITYPEFLDWWVEVGGSHLSRPSYKSSIDLDTPSDAQLASMFRKIDADGSGAVDLSEAQEALMVQWPYMDVEGFRRAFNAADEDGSGEVEEQEFKHLVKFTVWLNENRHSVQELEDTFTDRVGDDEFWYAFQQLGFSGSDGDAKYLYDRECQRLAQDPVTEGLGFEQYTIWAVKYACIDASRTETASETQARRYAIMSKELSNAAGEYGDVHFVDLAAIIIKGMRDEGSGTQDSELCRRFKAVVGTVIELSSLLKTSLGICRARNDSFPAFQEATVCSLIQMFYKEEFFSGQSIITQGEDDGTYYVLRRGRAEVIMDGRRIGIVEYGHGFGEIGLLLGIKRTCTIRCVTPCEVFALGRADYETLVASLPKEERIGPLAAILEKFWLLMTNPRDGSRRESVDYATYLKSHIRTSKTLTSNSDVQEFDEDEERDIAQSDWSEDCARYHLRVTETLNKSQYFSSMYQLVELWSEDCHLSFLSFLTWIFENICRWDTTYECYVFKLVDDVQAVGERFEKLKEDARAVQEAEKAAEMEALAIAEESRRQQTEHRCKMQHIAIEADRLAEVGRDLKKQVAELDDEEAGLLRRLASGELSPQEEAAARARLDAIAAERFALQAAILNNQLQAEMAEIDRQLAALGDEEAGLLRRLAAGGLPPDEEARIRARLSEIAAEREDLLQQQQTTSKAQRSAAADADDQAFIAQLAAIDRKLSQLDEEEAELRRRLAAGNLNAGEEAAIRSRLAEISAERNRLMNEQANVRAARRAAAAAKLEASAAEDLAAVRTQLAALDDEEAELLRRLAAGDLTADDEANIRARLAAIEAERTELRAQSSYVELSAKLASIEGKLAALDDEEEDLRRRLAAGGLSAEERAGIEARLAEIIAERDGLLEAQRATTRALLESGHPCTVEAANLLAKLQSIEDAQMQRKLAVLDDEEAELLRRLAEGALTAKEEAEIRARLAAIAEERASLYAQSKVRIDERLATLGDEEAELRRRLAAGNLAPEEEAAIIQRLAEIGRERECLLVTRDNAEAQHQRAAQEVTASLAAAAESSSSIAPQRSSSKGWYDRFSDFLYPADYPRAAPLSPGNPKVRAGSHPLNSSQLLWNTLGSSTKHLKHHHQLRRNNPNDHNSKDTDQLSALQTSDSHPRTHSKDKSTWPTGRLSAPPVLFNHRPHTRMNIRAAVVAAQAAVSTKGKNDDSSTRPSRTLPLLHMRRCGGSGSGAAVALFDVRVVQKTRAVGAMLPSLSNQSDVRKKNVRQGRSQHKTTSRRRISRRSKLHERPLKIQLRD